jgi:hypothetical protein
MTCQHPPDGDSSAAERIYHAFTPHFAPFVIHTTYPIFWNAKTSVDRHWSRDFLLHPHNEFCFLYRKVTTELTLALIWATPWPRLVQHFSRHRFATLLKQKKNHFHQVCRHGSVNFEDWPESKYTFSCPVQLFAPENQKTRCRRVPSLQDSEGAM